MYRVIKVRGRPAGITTYARVGVTASHSELGRPLGSPNAFFYCPVGVIYSIFTAFIPSFNYVCQTRRIVSADTPVGSPDEAAIEFV